jgi:methyl-accepting chemotaxis protein
MIDIEILRLDTFTIVACSIIIIAFIWAWIYIVRTDDLEINNRRKWIGQLPSIISTLGVLGTFAGITRGLISFDTDHLDTSIPVLLSGLKTAFFTSLLGMFGSMVLNRVVSHKFDNENKISDSEKAAKLIVDALNNNHNALSTILKNNNDSIIKAIEEHSIIKAIRQDVEQMKDDLEEIKGHIEEIKGISSEMAKNTDNTRTIVNTMSGDVDAIKKIEGGNTDELSRLKAVFVTATASISAIDNNIEEINKKMSALNDTTTTIGQNVEEILENSEEDS